VALNRLTTRCHAGIDQNDPRLIALILGWGEASGSYRRRLVEGLLRVYRGLPLIVAPSKEPRI
jgi:hypothetical protein